VSFAPGTEVEVTISPKPHNGEKPRAPAEQASAGGLRGQGNVLVQNGASTGPSDALADHRDERLRQLGGGRPG